MPTRYRIALIVALVVVAILAVAAGRVVNRIDNNAKSNRRASEAILCTNLLLGDFAGAVGRAFAAPPAPNPARDAATTDIKRTALRLANSQEVCAHGQPKPLVPTATP
jgi:type II secretory pathway pseudopilin PulG